MSVNRLTIEQFKDYIYDHLPEYYREQDSLVGKTLWKYLSIFDDGAFKFVIEDANGILDIIDPMKTPSFLLPHLFKSYGLEIFNGIPEAYQRSMLAIIGTLWKYKGTTTVIRYLTSLIAGVKTTITEEERTLTVVLDMDFENSEGGDSKLPSKNNLVRIIDEFLPFYTIAVIIYSYFYNEYTSISVKDKNNVDFVTHYESDKAKPSFTESGLNVRLKDVYTDTYRLFATESDSFLNDKDSLLSRTFILNNIENFHNTISYKGLSDGDIKPSEYTLNYIVKLDSEESSLSFSESVINKLKHSLSDSHRTSITDSDSLLNDKNNLLGKTLILNNIDNLRDTIMEKENSDSIIPDDSVLNRVIRKDLEETSLSITESMLSSTRQNLSDYYRTFITESDSFLNDKENVLGVSFILNNISNNKDDVEYNEKSDDSGVSYSEYSLNSVTKNETDESSLSSVSCINTDAVKESVVVENINSTFIDNSGVTNSRNSMLGLTFILNNAGCYDTIRKNGEEQIIYN